MASTVYKKCGNRRLNQMNGDHLTQLKEPIRSEMNRMVIGTNKGCIATMNRRLDLYYKDKNITLEKMRRRQDAVYGTMLRVQREKKILQKAMHKKRQEENREMHTIPNSDILKVQNDLPDRRTKPTQKEPKEKDTTGANVEAQDSEQENGYGKHSDSVEQNGVTKMPERERTFERKARVLEVRKKAPLAPLVRERSNLAADADTTAPKQDSSLSKFPNIRSELLPVRKMSSGEPKFRKESSVTDMAIDSVANAQFQSGNSSVDANVDTLRNSDAFPKNSHASRRMSKSTIMPTISEKDSTRDIPTRHSDELVFSKDNRRKSRCVPSTEPVIVQPVIRGAFDQNNVDTSNDPNSVINENSSNKYSSLVQRNKLRARANVRRQENIMKNEPIHIYLKDSKGNYVRSNAEFKRREFNPPSMKEKRFQEKMLRAQVDARIDQRNKLEDFFERMAQEERERQRIRDAFQRQAQEEAEAARIRAKDEEAKIGFSASQMATLFSKGVLPEGVDPSSFEAIKYCKYIRTYSPTSMEAARKQAARDGKLSSWDAFTNTITQNHNSQL